MPTQLCQVKYNTSYAPDFGVFEIGRVAKGLKSDGLVDEHKMLAITLFSKTKSVEKLYFELRDMLATFTDNIKHKSLDYAPATKAHSYEHPRNLNKIICDGRELGTIGIVHPVVSKKLDKKASIVFAEIDIQEFAQIANSSISYEEPSKYPAMEIDLSFVTDKFAPIKAAIEDAKSNLVKKIEVVDTYCDGDAKSITTRITFSHPEKTLTREEVMDIVNTVIDKLDLQGIKLKK